MNNDVSDLKKALEIYDFSALNAADCARALRRCLEHLREESFYSRQQQPFSILRLQRLLRELDADLDTKKKLHIILSSTLTYFDLSTLLTHTGLSRPHGFFQEIITRSIDKILPRHSPRPNFMDLVYFLFPVESDSDFFQKIPLEVYNQILALFDPKLNNSASGQKLISQHFENEILESLLILSAESLVLSESSLINDIRWTLKESNPRNDSFLKLHSFVNRVVNNKQSNPNLLMGEMNTELEEEFADLLADCRNDLSVILSHLEQSSLSVDLVYQLEVLQLLLDRIRALLFIFIMSGRNKGPKPLEFFSTLIAEEQRRRSVRVLIGQNLHFLARKIIDNAGETGDHYIARNPFESQELFKAALGGGFLTGFTVLFKILIHNTPLPLFFSGFFAALNFAGSFVTMQFLHLTLATKQPAMTAASLAKKMTGLSDLSALRDEMKSLLRSQTLTALGNLCAVIPCAYCLFLVWQLVFQAPLLSPDEARYVIESHSPLKSLTVFYALLTGVLLWTSSVVHGWVQNWMIFRGIPELLSDSFLVENFLSREKRVRLGHWLRHNLAGITANVALGILLAFTPILGSFFGLPLEVRHVTLATGSLTIAWASIPFSEINLSTVIAGGSGIFLILLGNLLTSFFLSLWLALRAKGWHLADIKGVLKTLYSSRT